MAVLSALGCATPADLGRIERLPEGTLPPVTEIGPAVNIQPPPIARPSYHPPLAHPYRDHGPFGPFGPFGWRGSRCLDPVFCGSFGGGSGYYRGGSRGRSGLGLHLRLF